MAADRRRDRLAAGHGWVTLRVTWEEIRTRPSSTTAEIGNAMEAQRATSARAG